MQSLQNHRLKSASTKPSTNLLKQSRFTNVKSNTWSCSRRTSLKKICKGQRLLRKPTQRPAWWSEWAFWVASPSWLAWVWTSTLFTIGMRSNQWHGCFVRIYRFIFLESFYMMVGSMFFIRYRADWAYTGIYDMLYRRNLKKLARTRGVDLEKAETLRAHITNLES